MNDEIALSAAQVELLDDARRAQQRGLPESDRRAFGLVDVQQGMRILDLGCGSGTHLGLLWDHVAPTGHVTGVDVDEDCVVVAGALWHKEVAGQRISVRRADVMDLPFADHTFDIVWASAMLHHLPEPQAALREAQRVMRPGGRVAIFDGDLGCSFPSLPWSPALEDCVRQASWRAASDNYGGTLSSFYDPFVGRRLVGYLEETGFIATTLHAVPEMVQAPLTDEQRHHLATWFQGWLDGRLRPYLAPSDHAALSVLFDVGHPGNLLAHPGFFMNRTWLLAIGQRPAPPAHAPD